MVSAQRQPELVLAKQQQGVALILAMLVVALVTAITIELSWRFDLSMTRAANRWHGVQARAYLLGAEELAEMALQYDLEDDQTEGVMIDTLTEIWAQPAPQFPTDEGWVRAGLEDAQGRFNLNHLKQKANKPKEGQTQPSWQRWTTAQRRFIRLLQTIELGTEEDLNTVDLYTAKSITLSIADWLDKDSNVSYIDGGEGAEADYYIRLEPPFIIANQEMISVSELLLVKGMTPEIYQKLVPLVIVLPEDMMMNVNTMPMQLLRTFNEKQELYPITEEAALNLFNDRGDGFPDLQTFKDSLETIAGVGNAENLDTTGLDVKSSYFLFFGDTMVGDHIRAVKAMMRRDNGEVSTLYRTDANF